MPLPEGGAQCVSSARWDLCGGRRATGVPTATIKSAEPVTITGEKHPIEAIRLFLVT